MKKNKRGTPEHKARQAEMVQRRQLQWERVATGDGHSSMGRSKYVPAGRLKNVGGGRED